MEKSEEPQNKKIKLEEKRNFIFIKFGEKFECFEAVDDEWDYASKLIAERLNITHNEAEKDLILLVDEKIDSVKFRKQVKSSKAFNSYYKYLKASSALAYQYKE